MFLGPSWRGSLPAPRSTFPRARDDEGATNAQPPSTTLGGIPAGWLSQEHFILDRRPRLVPYLAASSDIASAS